MSPEEIENIIGSWIGAVTADGAASMPAYNGIIFIVKELQSKITDLRQQRDNYKTIAEEATKAGLAWFDELRLARKVVECAKIAVKPRHTWGITNELLALALAVADYDSARALETPQFTEKQADDIKAQLNSSTPKVGGECPELKK